MIEPPRTDTPDDVLGRLRFDATGLIPAVVQDHQDGTVLMVAWMDAEAVRRTLTTGRTWFWSRSRQQYWQKGETSGHRQYVRSVAADCDADVLLVRIEQVGAACHNGTRSCFEDHIPARVDLSPGAAPAVPTGGQDAVPAAVQGRSVHGGKAPR